MSEPDPDGCARGADAPAVLTAVADRLGERASAASDPHVTVGEHVVMVDVESAGRDRLAGLAHRPPTGEDHVDLAAVTNGLTLATAGERAIDRAVGIATMNALSAPAIDWRHGDPMAGLDPAVDVVATVGLFRPAFRKFEDVVVRVVERDPPASIEAPAGVTVETYTPDACASAFADADVCFLTGSTLIYGGIERYLSALEAAAVTPVVLVGATASHLPGPAFDAGVDVVAGARVTDIDHVRARVAAGECGTDLHDHGVEKVLATRPGADPSRAGLVADPNPASDGNDPERTEPNQ